MPVVIKFLLDASGRSAWLAKKFLQEAEALTRINHPGVVRVIDRDQSEDGKPFFVMEFVRGRPLRDVMGAEGMDLGRAAMLIRQIGQALGAAHREGVFHRDLKPENIMLQTLGEGEEQIKLIDFGIAKVKDSEAGAATEVAVVAGSLNYMAPEQLAGEEVSAATDVYAFGIIAYEMITGRRPFNADAPSYVAAINRLSTMQRNETIENPSQLRPGLSPQAETILLRSLAFDPARRPQAARAFGEELARALTGSSGQAVATSPIGVKQTAVAHGAHTRSEEIPSEKSNKRIALIVACAMAIIAAAVVGWQIFSKSTPATPTAPAAAPVAEPERALTYSITVQKDPKRYPQAKPFQLPGEVVFSPGDRVRFTFGSPQPGHLYIINEGPAGDLNVLFPSETANGGSSLVSAAQQIQIPERGDGFVFDAEEGTEKLWLVWSVNALAELEAVRRWATSEHRGEIKDGAEAQRLRDLFSRLSTSAPEIEKDEEKKITTVKVRGETLVKLIKLEHH
jgi:serine/threonine protein kinase